MHWAPVMGYAIYPNYLSVYLELNGRTWIHPSPPPVANILLCKNVQIRELRDRMCSLEFGHWAKPTLKSLNVELESACGFPIAPTVKWLDSSHKRIQCFVCQASNSFQSFIGEM